MTFTIAEVERLVKNAYNVGLCDGVEGGDEGMFREYVDADDFWDKNFKNWLVGNIQYVN